MKFGQKLFVLAWAAKAVCAVAASTTNASPPFDSPPLSPAESAKLIHVRPGYEAELVAPEPLLESPVAIDWDERGRLWVVEMVDYPLGLDGKGKPGGRVRILQAGMSQQDLADLIIFLKSQK